jgi:hypothetical protein
MCISVDIFYLFEFILLFDLNWSLKLQLVRFVYVRLNRFFFFKLIYMYAKNLNFFFLNNDDVARILFDNARSKINISKTLNDIGDYFL